jgi:hypothetical protein
LNIKLNRDLDNINFTEKPFLSIDNISFVGPIVKDYSSENIALLGKNDLVPYSVNHVLQAARQIDAKGRPTLWYAREKD